MSSKIHKSAVVSSKAEIDDSVEIGPFCVIGDEAVISKGCKLHSHVVIEGRTIIGKNCQVYPFASIGLTPQDLKYKNEKTGVKIGSNNVIREYATIHRGSVSGTGYTEMGDNNFMMAYSHLAHDCRVGSSNVLANAATLAGHVLVQDFAFIGGLVAVHQNTRIGSYAMVGGFSGIGQDIPPFTMASGARAKLYGLNVIGLKRHGFDEETINKLKKSYKILFREKRTLQDALRTIKNEYSDCKEVMHLVAFIEENKRGICR